MNWPIIIAGTVGVISILASLVSVTVVFTQMGANISRLDEGDKKRLAREEALDKQVLELLVTLKEFMAAQTAVNVTVSGQLQNQVTTNERTAAALNDVVSRLKSVEHSTIEAGQIVSLLTEVLRQRKVIEG